LLRLHGERNRYQRAKWLFHPGSLKVDEPAVKVLVEIDSHIDLAKSSVASTTTVRPLVPVITKSKPLSLMTGELVCGFHSSAMRPPNVEAHPVVPGDCLENRSRLSGNLVETN